MGACPIAGVALRDDGCEALLAHIFKCALWLGAKLEPPSSSEYSSSTDVMGLSPEEFKDHFKDTFWSVLFMARHFILARAVLRFLCALGQAPKTWHK